MLEPFRKIWSFCGRRKGKMALALLFSFISSMFMTTRISAVALAIETLAGHMEPRQGIFYTAICCVVGVLGTFVTTWFVNILSIETNLYMVSDKRMDLAARLREASLGFFSDHSVGTINSVLTTSLSSIETAAILSLIKVISGFLSTLAMVIFLAFYEWPFALIAVAGIVVNIGMIIWQMGISRRLAPPRQRAQTKLIDEVMIFLHGIKVIKSFDLLGRDTGVSEAIAGSREANIRITTRSMPSQVIGQLMVTAFELIFLGSALWLGLQNGGLPLTRALVLAIVSFFIFAGMNQAGSVLSMIGLLESSISEVEEISDLPVLETLEPHEHAQGSGIRFENVSFAYGENEVLHDISVDIPEKGLTAVIGPSGSGKTTFCQLIARMWDVKRGAIRVGGADVRHLPTEELMAKLSMVFQKVYLFEDTILNNIRFARPDAGLEEVQEAARLARCDQFVQALPQGYETVVREGGANLSGGEKQRISIARAILKDAPIVLLDEATSALDMQNEAWVVEAINELIKNKTVVMIAHRMNTVRDADLILALEDGRIVEQGRPEELMRTGKIYPRFVRESEISQSWRIR